MEQAVAAIRADVLGGGRGAGAAGQARDGRRQAVVGEQRVAGKAVGLRPVIWRRP